jgi:hypothetical protein
MSDALADGIVKQFPAKDPHSAHYPHSPYLRNRCAMATSGRVPSPVFERTRSFS